MTELSADGHRHLREAVQHFLRVHRVLTWPPGQAASAPGPGGVTVLGSFRSPPPGSVACCLHTLRQSREETGDRGQGDTVLQHGRARGRGSTPDGARGDGGQQGDERWQSAPR